MWIKKYSGENGSWYGLTPSQKYRPIEEQLDSRPGQPYSHWHSQGIGKVKRTEEAGDTVDDFLKVI
ncbi:MAG: hypothetical protein R2827_05035 [Bdellovibrionales bacterium]